MASPKRGAVIEITTPRGLAYAQFLLTEPRYGSLLRLLPGVFPATPDLARLVTADELYLFYFPLGAALRRKIVRCVSTESVPERFAAGRPLMRSGVRGAPPHDGWTWWLQHPDGSTERLTRALDPAERRLSIYNQVLNDTMLVHRITTGWLPEHEV